MRGLGDKIVIVTGGGGGIGGATCRRFAEAGSKVAVFDIDATAAERVAADITASGGAAHAVACDITDHAAVAQAVAGVEALHGRVDVLVNNAGWDVFRLFKDSTPAEWQKLIAINLIGALNLHHAVLPGMIARGGGRIVNITSAVAYQGSTTGRAHYAAAKAGLANFTISLAREMAPHGIYVNSVAPGFMETEMVEEALRKNREQYLERIPLRRVAAPAEMVPAVLLLASERASYMTGTTVHVNGGMWMT